MSNVTRLYTRPYVGTRTDGSRIVFRTLTVDAWTGTFPTIEGPFKTTRAANYLAQHPEIAVGTKTVTELERLARA